MENTLFPVPPGTETVRVRIIDTTTRMGKLPVAFLMEPAMKGMQYMPEMPVWSFLIEHASGQKLLFDLGVAKAFRSLSPFIQRIIESMKTDISVKDDVIDILKEEIAPDQISGIIWSGRNLREIDFSDDTKAGRFRAFDFFGDGSFYLVDTPGHAVGHLGALARTTTNPDTFIFMGGDLCHHAGELRPSEHMSLPSDLSAAMPAMLLPCPGAENYEKLLFERRSTLEKPFFAPATMVGTDIEGTIGTIEKAQEADADSNIWFVSAHDPSLLGIADLFPLSANDWKQKGWRAKTLWAFLRDFDEAIDAQS
ncbi:unnamed protein product [Penicillium olsonii]|nr:unnamed protein product [Penicillium olsonii]